MSILKFDLYTGPAQNGPWSFLITYPYSPLSSSYSFVDPSGSSATWYRLDTIDTTFATSSAFFQVFDDDPPGNKIAWDRDLDTSISSYQINRGPTINGPWSYVNSISNDINSPNYNPSVQKFFYADASGSADSWYRVVPVDLAGRTGLPIITSMGKTMPYFVPGSTAFGIYDQDSSFVSDADNMVDFVKSKLGEPIVTVHMSSSNIYRCFEEACLEYSAMVNSYQAKSVLSNYLGSPTGTLSGGENQYVTKNLQFELYQADAFAAEAELNSMQPWYTGSITLNPGQQRYDLQALLSGSGPLTGSYDRARIRIRDVYHGSPLAPYRFFGTTSGLNYLNQQFRFESFTPETMFYLLPIWEDVLRGMQFKTSNNVRRSNYSFALHNNSLEIYPVPGDTRQLWLTYTVDQTPIQPSSGSAPSTILQGYNAVSNLSNIPFGNIPYSNINSMSKHWIRRMTLAFAKEVEGNIRAKYSTVPIPNGDVTLNGPELIADGRKEQDDLRNELKELLEETTYQKLMQKEQEMASFLNDSLKNVPMGIYIG